MPLITQLYHYKPCYKLNQRHNPGSHPLVPWILPLRTTDLTPSYPGPHPLVPRIASPRTPDLIPSYPGSHPFVPRIAYPRTPDLIPSYPGSHPLVPRISSPRTPDRIPSYPGSHPFVPRIPGGKSTVELRMGLKSITIAEPSWAKNEIAWSILRNSKEVSDVIVKKLVTS